MRVYDEFREEFGRDDRVMLAVGTEKVFDLAFLAKLRDFHEELESNVEQLDEVDSLINARNTRGDEDELIVDELLEDWPEDAAALERIEAYALDNPLYPNLLLSEDLKYTTLLLRFDTYTAEEGGSELAGFDELEDGAESDAEQRDYLTGEENAAIMAQIRAVIARYEGPGFEVALSGPPVFNERISAGVSGDMRRFLMLAVLVTAALLFLLFRRLSGTLLPIFVVVLALLTTMGFMPLLGMDIQVPTQILPAFLLAVGVGDSVHILTIFYQRLRQGDEKEGAIVFALGHSGPAILMTSATTAGALLSFAAAPLAPVANLGVLAPVGVTLALVYSVALLPALLAVLPLRASRSEVRAPLASLDRLVVRVGDASTANPRTVVAIFLVLVIVSAAGAARLRFSHNPIDWFDPSDEVRVDTELLNRELKGVVTMEVLFDTGRENGLHEPALLKHFDALTKLNETLTKNEIFIGKTISLVDVVKETHRALNENRDEFRVVPDDRLLVAQELLLFENSGSDDLQDFVDSRFQIGRMTLKMPWVDAIAYPDFIELIEERYAEVLGDEARIVVTGRLPLLGRTFDGLISSLSRSYVIAFLIITPLMMLLLANVRWGLISMAQNLAPILITLGVMGWFHFPLDGFTLLIGSIAIGLAVDDTIHFMHNFRRSHDRGNDVRAAVRETLETTGQALLFTTLVLCSGFIVFIAGDMQSTVSFGFLTSLALAVAFIADITLAPALVMLFSRRDE
jgi:predicted RND superfamily exporter protein